MLDPCSRLKQTRREVEIVLNHLRQLTIHVFWPPFDEEANTLIGSQYSRLFHSSVYCSCIASEGVRNAYIVSVWNRALNCHHLQCRHEALPSDFLSHIESFSPFKGVWIM